MTKNQAPKTAHEATTANANDAEDNFFGCCPTCGKQDGYFNIYREHWFVCDVHRVKWLRGENLFSSWRRENKRIWRRNAEFLARYTDVGNAAYYKY